MELEMVLNELSLQPLAKTVPEARQRMSDLISTMKAAVRAGVSKSLQTHNGLKPDQIAPDYPVARWLNDPEVDKEDQRYFKLLATRSPEQTIGSRVDSTDFFHNGDRVIGLGIVYFLDALALSMRSEIRWHSSHLKLKYTYLDSNGEILEEDITVVHASHKDHISEHVAWIKERISLDIEDGSDLWRYREHLFPNLQCCASVGEALQSLNAGNSYLHLVAKKLGELEKACQQWQEHGGAFDVLLKGSVDSEPTLLKYHKERTFYCPDGQPRRFSLHICITSDWRIYYHPVGETKQLIIGYIGKHLPTVKYS